jgi:hypothetical protein
MLKLSIKLLAKLSSTANQLITMHMCKVKSPYGHSLPVHITTKRTTCGQSCLTA